MRKFKKALAVVASLSMVLSLTACGKEKDDSEVTKTESITVDDGSSVEDTTDDASVTDVDEEYDWTVTEEEIASANEKYNVKDGDVIFDFNFDDNDLAGFTTYTNGGICMLKASEGQLCAEIRGVGTVEHGCQAYWDGLVLIEGCVYTMSFDVSCDIERPLEWRIQMNGGDYHAYAGDIISIGTDVTTVNVDFTMEESSDPAPRLAFNMGFFEGMNKPVDNHVIKIDNLKLVVKDSKNSLSVETVPAPKKVRVNQIGYRPNDIKKVVTSSDDDRKFKVINVETGEEVYIGNYDDSMYDAGLGGWVRVGDFSEVKTVGRYKILSAPSGESYEFDIGDNLYKDIYKDIILMLYNQRCGAELDKNISGEFAHDACHMDKALVYGEPDVPAKDVSGGWHDAGDYGRYIVAGAKTIQDLFLAYEDYGASFDDVGIPESGNGVPDLLDEAKYELDFFLKMQDEATGGVYHKVSCLVFPEVVMPEAETAQLYLAPISYAATADFAAVMAKASVLYREFDEEFADKCLLASENAYSYIKENEAVGYVNPEEIVTGEYPDRRLMDEAFWAAAELYIVTGDGEYLNDVKQMIKEDFGMGLGWASIGTYACYDLAKADSVDNEVKDKAKELLLKEADSLIELCRQSSLGTDQIFTFEWGSNMRVANTGMTLLMADRLNAKDEYKEYAQRQRDYIFGQNGTAYCYVTGYGSLSPEHTHHRPSQFIGKSMKGMLVGGANSSLEDPYAKAVLQGVKPALAYVDNDQSYSCNEITIYWNSPLIYLMTGLE